MVGSNFKNEETLCEVAFLRVYKAAEVGACLADGDEGYGIEEADDGALKLCG